MKVGPWPGWEGKPLDVIVTSRYPKVRLYLNDKLVEEKDRDTGRAQDYQAKFTIPYQPGTLKAVGVDGGKEVESKILVTTGDTTGLRLVPDRTDLHADGQDLSFISVEAIDKDCHLQPNADALVTFALSGPGTIRDLAMPCSRAPSSIREPLVTSITAGRSS